MASIIGLLIVVSLSILITRIATIALTHTGLSKEAARFQTRSAFTGVGFTTSESEKVVGHPVRRKVLLLLMLLGNAGIVTAMSGLIVTFVNTRGAGSITLKIVLLVSGLVCLWGIASSQWVDRRLSNFISKALEKYTRLDIRDFAKILHLAGEYQVTELQVQEEDWLNDRTLAELVLRDEGIVVLGINREDGTYLGAPEGDTKLSAGDTLIMYGRGPVFENLDQRQKGFRGDLEHQKVVAEQEDILQEQKEADPA